MNLSKYVILMFAFILRCVIEAETTCIISDNSVGVPPPVFTQYGKYLTLNTQISGTIHITCPGGNVYLGKKNTRSNDLVATCFRNNQFRVNYEIYYIKDITCGKNPSISTNDTETKCYEGSTTIRVGYEVQRTLLPLYEACFDGRRYTTHYVKHQLDSRTMFQKNCPRPEFTGGVLFNRYQMSKVYVMGNQKKRLDMILGPGEGNKNVTKRVEYLNRGHLAARADFSLCAEQYASFHYVNVAPQWKQFNAGDWEKLETALRDRAYRNRLPLTVYTGTHGVMTLPDSRGTQRQVYLDADRNNNGIIRVPKYFYKLVYDPAAEAAAAFVSLNLPDKNRTQVYTRPFCNANCAKHSWLPTSWKDVRHNFCCDYGEFVRNVRIPFGLNVQKVLDS